MPRHNPWADAFPADTGAAPLPSNPWADYEAGSGEPAEPAATELPRRAVVDSHIQSAGPDTAPMAAADLPTPTPPTATPPAPQPKVSEALVWDDPVVPIPASLFRPTVSPPPVPPVSSFPVAPVSPPVPPVTEPTAPPAETMVWQSSPDPEASVIEDENSAAYLARQATRRDQKSLTIIMFIAIAMVLIVVLALLVIFL